jgi:hypothetical protein
MRTTPTFAAALFLGLAACGSTETAGDFTYACTPGGGMYDGPSCEHRLTDHYLLRYGESSGDNVTLDFEFSRDGGSARLIADSSQDIVTQIALDDRILAVRLRSGRIFVAPAKPARWPEITGPLDEQTFSARFANPPRWREVQ